MVKMYILCLAVEGFNLGVPLVFFIVTAQLGWHLNTAGDTSWLLCILMLTVKLTFLLLSVLKFEVSVLILSPC